MSSSSWVVTPGDDVGHERVEDLGGEAAGGAHAGKAFRPVQLDRPVAADDAGFAVEEGCVHGTNIVAQGWFDETRSVMPKAMADERIWTAGLVVIGDEISPAAPRTGTSRRSRPGSTCRGSGSPKCGSCPTIR